MTSPAAPSMVRLLAELLELDREISKRRQPLTLAQKQRRAVVCRDLHGWALERQRRADGGSPEQRQHPRAQVKLKVQMLGGPRPIELMADSLAVGGLRVHVSFQPRTGDVLALRLLLEPEPPVEVMSKVVWYDPVRSRVGLAFLDLDEPTRELVERIVFSDLVKPL